ncbi:hypothetical protein BD410DRAFT_298446 [Rickenella mellea]|uniref:Uncharacterized protein n=1 Tax=Rickenella mellea TaxID=50990 RepID=A0A4Y7Q2B7_9AGAM|nr:hypothetical protein BD410DRAFT_298446 [Rickenella mellea]
MKGTRAIRVWICIPHFRESFSFSPSLCFRLSSTWTHDSQEVFCDRVGGKPHLVLVPGYIFTTLRVFSWVFWISPSNIVWVCPPSIGLWFRTSGTRSLSTFIFVLISTMIAMLTLIFQWWAQLNTSIVLVITLLFCIYPLSCGSHASRSFSPNPDLEGGCAASVPQCRLNFD